MTEKIVFQGEHYAFSEIAARLFFKEQIECIPSPTFEEVFLMVEDRRAQYGIIPIENTTYGSIHRNFDLLLEKDVVIVGEVNLRIALNLIGLPGAHFDQIRTVYSHPAALEQSRKFLAQHPCIEAVSSYDTAGSVKLISEKKDPTVAAIASRQAAQDYNMQILQAEIEDYPENYTRFFIISKEAHVIGVPNKTSIVIATKNMPGALFKSLSVFFLRDINLTKIESRPRKGRPWEYLFFLDFSGSSTDEPIQNALRHLGEIASFIKILGSYPSAQENPIANHI
ncbi:prephenate dehydratase [candidate division KSB1 bacterium]|nr:prephenate dehydratase [candidate division KSB1 bacterium]